MDKDNINKQIILSIASILGISVSIILLFNSKAKLEDNDFLDNPYDINFNNRIFFTIIFGLFIITNYHDYIKAKEKGLNISPYLIQLYASILIFIATLLSLYVAYTYKVGSLENPDI